jgi:hypothetical protein
MSMLMTPRHDGPELAKKASTVASRPERLIFIMGLDGYQPDSVRGDIWIDDLVINAQRVGCPAAQ